MSEHDVILIGRELLVLAILLSIPVVGVSLVVGLAISILQTLTSIQEQTLSFAPRIVAVALVLIATLPWTLRLMIDFTQRMFMQMAHVTQ